MKVKLLIEKLQKMDPEATVLLGDRFGKEILYVDTFENMDGHYPVWLETEDDVDMKEEINAMFNYFIENDIDELDGYTEMLDIGITPDMVREHVGDEAADHMEKFMEKHGL